MEILTQIFSDNFNRNIVLYGDDLKAKNVSMSMQSPQ